jgi:hypothetical protein
MEAIAGKVFLTSGLILFALCGFIAKFPETRLSDRAVMGVVVAFFASVAVFVASGLAYIWF